MSLLFALASVSVLSALGIAGSLAAVPAPAAAAPPITARWGLDGGGVVTFGQSAPAGTRFTFVATDESSHVTTCRTIGNECELDGLTVDQVYDWVAYQETGSHYSPTRTQIGQGRGVLSRSLPQVSVIPGPNRVQISLAVPDAALADTRLRLDAEVDGYGEDCSVYFERAAEGCVIGGLRNGKTYTLNVTATLGYPSFSYEPLTWPLLSAAPVTPMPVKGIPTINPYPKRLRATNKTRKAVLRPTVATKYRDVTITSREIKAWRGRKLVSRGTRSLSLDPGKYKVLITVKYRNSEGSQVLKQHARVTVLPARRPLGAQPSLKVLMYDNDGLAYLFDPWDDLYDWPMTVGQTAELNTWPSSVSLSSDASFYDLQWKSWTSARAYAQGTMYRDGKRRRASLVFDSPETVTCRSTYRYSDVVTYRQYQRFGWIGGYKHVNIEGRWMHEDTWYWLSTPSQVYKNGKTYEC